MRDFFVRLAFGEVGIDLEFRGEGVNEKAFIVNCNYEEFQLGLGKEILSIDPNYFRPVEIDFVSWRFNQSKR